MKRIDNSPIATPVQPEPSPEEVQQSGASALKQHLASNFIPSPNPVNHRDAAHAILSHNLLDISKNKLRDAENQSHAKNAHKFLSHVHKTGGELSSDNALNILKKASLLVQGAPGVAKLSGDNKYRVTHEVMKAAANNDISSLGDVISHNVDSLKGISNINKKVSSLFKENYEHEPDLTDLEHKKAKDWVLNNFDKQLNAAAGKESIQPLVNDVISRVYPEQAILMAESKTRIKNYLNSLRPQEMPRLPFDSKQDNSLQDKVYKNALNTAIRPLSILDKVKTGKLMTQDLKNLVGTHPELYDMLKAKITAHITADQLSDDRPNLAIRQALSLFMGTPLESTFTPFSIQAAQSTFISPLKAPQPPQTGPKGKRGTSTLGKSNASYNTPNQAAEADKAKRD